jgi:hypothetical protein
VMSIAAVLYACGWVFTKRHPHHHGSKLENEGLRGSAVADPRGLQQVQLLTQHMESSAPMQPTPGMMAC